ncbi:MAG TPA: hypothetical protein VG148_07190 [Pyrinomonadaceae bacterium]|nr:hypothetical protein [Pyrinomonadaceae bacterium]
MLAVVIIAFGICQRTGQAFTGISQETDNPEVAKRIEKYLASNFGMRGYETSWYYNIIGVSVRGNTVSVKTTLAPDESKASNICGAVSGFAFSNENRYLGLTNVQVYGKDGQLLINRRGLGERCAAAPTVIKDYVTPKVDVEYDRFKDVTVVSISPVFVINPNPTGLQFGLMSGYKGKIPVTPKSVVGVFMSASPSEYEKYKISRGVIFLSDGERINLGTATHALDYRSGFFIEAMLIDIPFETLQKINRAKTVEVQIGSTEFVVPSVLQDAMREFAGKLAP